MSALGPAGLDIDSAPGQTLALLILQGGEAVVEHYASGVGPDTTLPSWSIAKSVLHAAVGVLVGEGRLALDMPTPVDGATLDHLLQMRAGLAWNEDYTEGAAEESDVQHMLFGTGREDTAAVALSRPRVATPGSEAAYCYSSGTSNIVSAMVADEVGRGDDYRKWLHDSVLRPVGMPGAIPKLDGAGVWIASSYCFATARDFARLGELYLAGGSGVLPDGWVESGTQPLSHADEGMYHGRHWWSWDDDFGTFEAHGYEGQSITVVPSLDLVIVRLGRTPESDAAALEGWRRKLVATLSDR